MDSQGRRLSAHYTLIQYVCNMGYCWSISFASVFLLSRGFANAEVGITLMFASALAIREPAAPGGLRRRSRRSRCGRSLPA